MLCDNCLYVIVIQESSEPFKEDWGYSSSNVSACENELSSINQHTYEHSGIVSESQFKCDQYTPKLNLKNRITSLS